MNTCETLVKTLRSAQLSCYTLRKLCKDTASTSYSADDKERAARFLRLCRRAEKIRDQLEQRLMERMSAHDEEVMPWFGTRVSALEGVDEGPVS